MRRFREGIWNDGRVVEGLTPKFSGRRGRGWLGSFGRRRAGEERRNGRDGEVGPWVEGFLNDRAWEMRGDREGEEMYFSGNRGDEESGRGNAATRWGRRRA